MKLLDELKRRKVLRTAGLYIVAAWLVLQAAEVLVGLNTLPETIGQPLLLVLLIGFPMMLLLSWFLQWTPSGVVAEESDSTLAESIRPFAVISIALVLAVVGWFVMSKGQLFSSSDAKKQVAIAVLPFVVLDSDNTQEYLADGITEQLMGLLARIPGMAVTSRTSAFSFKGSSVGLHDISKSLAVNYVLSGSVQRHGKDLRVRAELVDASVDVNLWSNTYSLSMHNLFSAQDEIAESVAAAVELEFSGAEHASLVTDPDVLQLYLRGMHAHALGSVDGYHEAVKLCSQSVALDPAYAPAYECMASAYTNLANRNAIPQKQGYELAEGMAHKAIKHEPNASFAHQTLGFIRLYHDGDLAAAATSYRRAVQTKPGAAGPKSGLALLLASIGRFDEAVVFAEQATRQDPINAISQANLAAAYFWAGRWADALDTYRLLKTLSPNSFALQYRIAECLVALNRPEEALAAAQLEGNAMYRMVGLVLAHQAVGDAKSSGEVLQQLVKNHGDIAAYNIAYLMAYRDEIDGAFEFLERQLTLSGSGVFSEILGDPWFEPLYDDPRWPQFLSKVGRDPKQVVAVDL